MNAKTFIFEATILYDYTAFILNKKHDDSDLLGLGLAFNTRFPRSLLRESLQMTKFAHVICRLPYRTSVFFSCIPN